MSAQPQSTSTGTAAGDARLDRAVRRRAETGAAAPTDVSSRTARAVNTEVSREAAAREALRQLASAAEIPVKPTRTQRKADRVAAQTAAGTVGATPAKLPAALKPGKGKSSTRKPKTAKQRWAARKKLVHRIPGRMKKTRALAWVVVGTVAGATGTARTAAKAAKAARQVARRSDDTPRPRRTAGHRRPFGSKYSCCDKTYSTPEALNAHFLAEHGSEEAVAQAPEQALLAPGTTRSLAGKLLVLLPPSHAGKRRRVPAGRHRPGKRRVSADAYVRTHRDQITRIGEQAMTDCGEARNVAQALIAWGEMRPRADRPWTLDELRGVLIGLERAMIVGTEAVDTIERTLNRPGGEQRGCNIDPSITRPGARRTREGLAEAARGLTQMIADFELYYAPFLRGQLAAPAIRMNR